MEVARARRAWEEEVAKQPTTVFINYALSHDQSLTPSLAAVMCAYPGSTRKFLFRCQPVVKEAKELLVKVVSNMEVVCMNTSEFTHLFRHKFGVVGLEMKAVSKKKTQPRFEALCEIADRKNIRYCRGMVLHPIFFNHDINECVLHHLAAALDLIST